MGKFLLAFGGNHYSRSVPTRALDSGNDLPSCLSVMPTPVGLWSASAGLLRDGNVITCGGRNSGVVATKACFVYDVRKNIWRAAAKSLVYQHTDFGFDSDPNWGFVISGGISKRR